jgi:hypothetical protein
MTDDHAMSALPPTCKPDEPDDANMPVPPIVLLPPQAAISVEIANDGDVILRQECALGGDPDQIIIARANLSAFLEALIDITPHGHCWYDLGEVRPEWSSVPETVKRKGADVVEKSARRTPAAERQRRYRERKRGDATGGPSANLEAAPSQSRPCV